MMITQKTVVEFEQIIEKGCGMDVHKDAVVATVSGIGINKSNSRSWVGSITHKKHLPAKQI